MLFNLLQASVFEEIVREGFVRGKVYCFAKGHKALHDLFLVVEVLSLDQRLNFGYDLLDCGLPMKVLFRESLTKLLNGRCRSHSIIILRGVQPIPDQSKDL